MLFAYLTGACAFAPIRRCATTQTRGHAAAFNGMLVSLISADIGMFCVLDLFSGIGGFSLGLERTGGFKTVAFCENEHFCQRVLAKHWPEIPCYDDIRSLSAERLSADGITIDVLCGGFPCQDISRAGYGAGIEGDRSGLWREYARLVRELRPRYVIVENVAAILDGDMGAILADLADCGYDAEWSIISGCAVGAPHMRQRMYCLAYPNGLVGSPRLWDTAAQSDWSVQANDSLARARDGFRARLANPSELYRGVNGLPAGLDRNRAIGNSVLPIIPEMIGRAILAAEPAYNAD